MGKQKQTNPIKFHISRTLSVELIAGLAVILIIGAAIYFNAPKKEITQQQPVIQEIDQKNNQARRTGNYDAGISAWEEYLKEDRTPEERYRAYQEIASFYVNKKDLQSALDNYRKAESINPTISYGLALAIATTTEKMNDKNTAREYYQKAISVLDMNDPLYDANKASLEQKVQSLQ